MVSSRRGRAVILSLLLLGVFLLGTNAVRRSDDDIDEEPQDDAQMNEPEPMEPPKEAGKAPEASDPSQASTKGDGYDPDEFTEGSRKESKSEAKPEAPKATTPETPADDSLPPYFLEGSMACIIVAFAINFFIGMQANKKIAHEWAELILSDTSRAGLQMNFALVGDNSTRLDKVLKQDSYSHYMMHATGRRHCKSLLATLNLTKRQDLLALCYNQLFVKPSQSADTLKIQIPLNDMAKFCVAICAKTEVSTQKFDCSDIKKFTEPVATKKIPKELTVLTDCEEVLSELLRGEDTVKAIDKLKQYIRVIHISDKSESDPRYPCMLRCEFQLPALKDKNDGRETAKKIMQLAIHLIDVCARASDWCMRHPQVSSKVEQRRSDRAGKSKKKHERQQELAASRKDAKAAAEKEKMENMGAEELRKYEEKKYRQDMKAKMKRQQKTKMMRS